MTSPFDHLLQTIEALETGQELNEAQLHRLLTLADRGRGLRNGAERVRSLGRWMWQMPLAQAVYEYRLAREETEALVRCPEGPELERRLLCTLYTRGTIARLVEEAWACRSRLPGKGVRLLQRAVRLADGLLPVSVLEDLEHEGTPGHAYLQALQKPTPWRHPREAPASEFGRVDGRVLAGNVASFLARTGPRAVRGSHLTEGDFLAARIVEEQEHQIHDQVRTRAYLANALRTAGRIPEAAAAWHDIDTLLRPERWFLPPPDALMGEVHSLRAAFQQDIGELGAAEASVLQAQDLLRRAGDEEGAAIQRVQRMAILYDDGRPEEVLQVRADVFELPIWLRPYWRHTVAAAYVDLGLVEEARRVYQQLDPPETPRAKAAHELLRANLLCLEGATAAALLAYRSAQRQYKVVGSSGEVLIALLGEVMVLCEEGQVDEACSLVARGTPLVSSVPDPAVQAAFQVVFRAAQAGTLTRQALSACVVAARRARKKSLRG